jgi:hypothetical protein
MEKTWIWGMIFRFLPRLRRSHAPPADSHAKLGTPYAPILPRWCDTAAAPNTMPKTKRHEQPYDSSAAFDLTFLNVPQVAEELPICGTRDPQEVDIFRDPL